MSQHEQPSTNQQQTAVQQKGVEGEGQDASDVSEIPPNPGQDENLNMSRDHQDNVPEMRTPPLTSFRQQILGQMKDDEKKDKKEIVEDKKYPILTISKRPAAKILQVQNQDQKQQLQQQSSSTSKNNSQDRLNAIQTVESQKAEIKDLTEKLDMVTHNKEMAEEKAEKLQSELNQANENIAKLTIELETLKEQCSTGRVVLDSGEVASVHAKQLADLKDHNDAALGGAEEMFEEVSKTVEMESIEKENQQQQQVTNDQPGPGRSDKGEMVSFDPKKAGLTSIIPSKSIKRKHPISETEELSGSEDEYEESEDDSDIVENVEYKRELWNLKIEKRSQIPHSYYSHHLPLNKKTGLLECSVPGCSAPGFSRDDFAQDHLKEYHHMYISDSFLPILEELPEVPDPNKYICTICSKRPIFETHTVNGTKHYASSLYGNHYRRVHKKHKLKCNRDIGGEYSCEFSTHSPYLMTPHLNYHDVFDSWLTKKRIYYLDPTIKKIKSRLLQASDFTTATASWSLYVHLEEEELLYTGYTSRDLKSAVVGERRGNKCKIHARLSTDPETRREQFNEDYAFYNNVLATEDAAKKIKSLIRYLVDAYSVMKNETLVKDFDKIEDMKSLVNSLIKFRRLHQKKHRGKFKNSLQAFS